MKITIVRHGQTEENYESIMQGRSNNLMNDTGRRQCQRLRDKLKDKEFDYCYTSPLVRCVETAFILIGDRVEMIRDDRLIERELGELEGKARELYDINKYWDYELNSNDLGVESVQSIINRSKEFLDYIKTKYDDNSSILIVTHGGVFRSLRILLNNKKLTGNLYDENIENCSYEEFEI